MDQDLDARLAEYLCSRLCHELVGPIGAANNGIELIQELGDEKGEAFALLAESSALASQRLLFYRMAYGAAGYRGLSTASVVRNLATAICPKGKIAFKDEGLHADKPFEHHGFGKLLLNLVAVAIECLPGGGIIEVNVKNTNPWLQATGKNVRLPTHVEAALKGEFSKVNLEALTAQAIYTGRLAQRLNVQVQAEFAIKNAIKFTVHFA
ncbi:MAG: histidine phosphotransferase family protein [Alphaproteobacteria bacterium]